MKQLSKSKKCPLCGGALERGATVFTTEMGFGVVVVRNVPATVCSQCGEDWIGAKEARRLETIVAGARADRREVEVVKYKAA